MRSRPIWVVLVACLAPGAACTAEVAPVDSLAEGDASNEALSTAPGSASPTPSDRTRFLICSVKDTDEADTATFRGKVYRYKTDEEVGARSGGWEQRATIDDRALDGLVPTSDRALVIDIRRVRGKPAYAYFGAHGKLHETFEP